MSQRDVIALLTLFLFVGILALTIRSIDRKSKLVTYVAEPLTAEQRGGLLQTVRAQYVSTVLAANPLERFAAKELLFRGRSLVEIYQNAIFIHREGEQSIQIASESIQSITRESASIDRGLEPNGLLAISWLTNSTFVTTNLRIESADDSVELFELFKSVQLKEAHS